MQVFIFFVLDRGASIETLVSSA